MKKTCIDHPKLVCSVVFFFTKRHFFGSQLHSSKPKELLLCRIPICLTQNKCGRCVYPQQKQTKNPQKTQQQPQENTKTTSQPFFKFIFPLFPLSLWEPSKCLCCAHKKKLRFEQGGVEKKSHLQLLC